MSLQVPSLANILSNPLPPVVKQVAQAVVDDVKQQDPQPQQDQQPQKDDDKIVIILHTKEISQEDRDLLKKFGRVRDMNYSMFNLDLSQLDCDYLLVDVRDKLNKLHITRVDIDKFKFCAYVHPFQKHDNIFEDFKEDINVLTKFPHEYKVAFKSEFDDVLTSMKKIKNSSCFLSLVSFLVNGFQSLSKK